VCALGAARGDVDGCVARVEEAREFFADAGGGAGYDVDFAGEVWECVFCEGGGGWEGLGDHGG